MTLPNERTSAIKRTEELLLDLLDSKKTPKVPRYVRLRAASCLRHYPRDYDMEQVTEKVPEVFS